MPLLLLSCAIGLLLASSGSQAVAEMTPATVEEAIALGRRSDNLRPYELRADSGWGTLKHERMIMGAFSTPFLRVALAAHSAKRQYKPFSAADVTPEMTAPVLIVYGFAAQVPRKPIIANVLNVIILPKGGKGADDAIHPTSTSEGPVEFKNLYGFSMEGKSMAAVFPLTALREGNEVHVLYDNPVNREKRCTDCKTGFNLKNIR